MGELLQNIIKSTVLVVTITLAFLLLDLFRAYIKHKKNTWDLEIAERASRFQDEREMKDKRERN
jgi:hypothetical protein